MKSDAIVTPKYSKTTDLRTRRGEGRNEIEFSHTLADIAKAAGISKDQVCKEKSRGYYDPDDLRSIVVYIARKILFKEFK